MEDLRRALGDLGLLFLDTVVPLLLVEPPELMVAQLLTLAVLHLHNLGVDGLRIHFYLLINLLLCLIFF